MPNERTALHALHAELGARFTAFAGYDMPIQYRDGLRAEHLHTRAHAGLFDVSHMGQVRVTGPDLHRALERALPLDFNGWPIGAQRYSLLLNERGGIEDDLMVTRLADEVRMVVNASGRDKDLALLREYAPKLSFELLDRALIALQGLDIHSTRGAVASGDGREANPAMEPIVKNSAAFIAVKAGATAGVIWASEKMWKKHRKAAVVFATAINVAMAAIVANNYRLSR